MRYGLDLGGTKVEIAALADDGTLVARRRVPSPQGDYGATIATLRDLVFQTDREIGRTPSVGIGIPGTISPVTGLVKNANSVWLIGHPLDKDLAEAIGRPVRVANDADCFVLSEASDGAAAGARSVFGVIVGTGVGGGLVYEGRMVSGPNSIAGEWGHNPLPAPRIDAGHDERPGPKCYCGRSGCIETFLSGPAFARDHEAWTGESLRPEEIVAAATCGNASARASVTRYADRLARALGTVINLFDPEVIVFGGGMSNAGFIYEKVPKMLSGYVFSDAVATRVVRNKHGDSSGVRGAAWLWPA